jgi:hypothetical protein
MNDYPAYIYRGDRMTDEVLKGQRCTAVRRSDGKCIRGSNGNMLIEFDSGRIAVVLARRLKKVKPFNSLVTIMNEEKWINTLFNSVELELTDRWKSHNVPPVFAGRPQQHLRIVVKAWWQIYQESICAVEATDRTVWERRSDCAAEPLDTPALVASLQQITNLINLDALLRFRPASKGEEAALALLTVLTHYYLNPDS